MEDKKIIVLLTEYHKSFENIGVTLQWIKSYLNQYPSIKEIPEELAKKIEESELEIITNKQMIESIKNRLISLGKKEEND